MREAILWLVMIYSIRQLSVAVCLSMTCLVRLSAEMSTVRLNSFAQRQNMFLCKVMYKLSQRVATEQLHRIYQVMSKLLVTARHLGFAIETLPSCMRRNQAAPKNQRFKD